MKTTIEMAREAAGDDWGLFQEYMPEIHRLVEFVRADERAKMAEQPAQQKPCCMNYAAGTTCFSDPRIDCPHLQPAPVAKPHEQEPVAWMQNTTAGLYVIDHYDEWHCIPLYTSPPAQRKPLTDEQIYKITNDLFYGNGPCDTLTMCRAIEATHGIKEQDMNITTTYDEAMVKAMIAEAVAREREECAKVCEDIDTEYEGEDVLATWCAAAIRARGSNT